MTTALAIYAALCSTLAVVLVLRLSRSSSAQADFQLPASSGPDLGASVPQLTVTSPDGRAVQVGVADAPHLLAFFSTTCEGCLHSLPGLLTALRVAGFSSEMATAVIVGPPAAIEKVLLSELGPVTRLVREPAFGLVATAYSVNLFPFFVLIEDGLVVGKGHAPEELRLPAGHKNA